MNLGPADHVTQLLEDRYSESFELWHHTARWRLLARAHRRFAWCDWLHALNGYHRESWVGREAAEHTHGTPEGNRMTPPLPPRVRALERKAPYSALAHGLATLAAGTVTVNDSGVTATSRILLTHQSAAGTLGFLRISARVTGTSFTITSANPLDTSIVAWLRIEP